MFGKTNKSTTHNITPSQGHNIFSNIIEPSAHKFLNSKNYSILPDLIIRITFKPPLK